MPIVLLLAALLSYGADRGALRTRDGRILSWGGELREWTLDPLRPRLLKPGPFGEGGCLADLDRDGKEEFIAVRGAGLGRLLWMPLNSAGEEQIDDEIESADCLEAELHGRRGVLLIHRGAQVRFYQRTAKGSWHGRDIYSIYTPSYQRGLALADVDGDGRTDIFCGNYWIRSPERFEESWRLFAIHTWFERPDSAAVRIAVLSPRRIAVAQAREAPARFAVFDAPADPAQPWRATPVTHDLGRVLALATSGGEIIAGGKGGLMAGTTKISSEAVTAVVPLGDGQFFVTGPSGARVVRQRPARR